MEIQKERVGETDVATVSGRLDGIYATAFAKEVGELITGTNPKILIDFTDIDYVSSAGLRALLVKKRHLALFALCGLLSRCEVRHQRLLLDVQHLFGP